MSCNCCLFSHVRSCFVSVLLCFNKKNNNKKKNKTTKQLTNQNIITLTQYCTPSATCNSHVCPVGGAMALSVSYLIPCVLSLWRGYLVLNKQPVRVESTFSYLEICSINIHSLTQVQTDRQTLSFSVLHVEELEAMVSHMIGSLKRIFPDSSPGKLLKTVTPDLQQKLLTLTTMIEEQVNSQSGSCGGFSDTYAALCDFNEMPFREEIQWDVDNIYYIHNWRKFNLQDFSHLDSRDLALAVAALSFNQWFTKIYCKELKLVHSLVGSFLCVLVDFAIKMAAALQEHPSSVLQSINLSGNPIEDKGGLLSLFVHGLFSGLGCLSQVLSSCQLFSASLTHLNLSGNPGSLVTEEATVCSALRFLSSTNSLSHLDLSDTSCPLDTVSEITNLSKTITVFLCVCRKVREVTRSIQEFFSQGCELKYVGLSGTKLPPQALRLLLQGLATNTRLFGLELDLSSCEVQYTFTHILDISDNGFENDMVTLVLSVGRCHSLRHLTLGRNFAMKSRALTDVLHRIAQLIQDEECPLQSLSVCDSRLKTGMHILLSALGSHAALVELDISGNNIGDTGAKMLAKALMNNTRLRILTWDRNNVTARGFQDVADALEWNFTLQQMPLPLADITQSYRSNPDGTKEALHKVSTYNLAKYLERSCHFFRSVCLCLQRLNQCNMQEVKADILTAHEVLDNARECCKVGMTEELMMCAEATCPRVVQRSSVCECLSECVSKRSRQTDAFLKTTLVENTGHIIINRLRELRQTLRASLAESIIEQILLDLKMEQDKMDALIKENSCNALKINVPELQLVDTDFPTDDYSPAFWRNGSRSKSLRPAPSLRIPLSVMATSPSPSTSLSPSPLGCGGRGRREGEVSMLDAAAAISGARGASFIPPPSLPFSARAPEEEAAGHGGLSRQPAPFPGCSLSPGPLPSFGFPTSLMEPLPTQGQTLRHYTASRPRPRHTRTHPPSSRPQEPVSKVENETSEGMGRVDEGVEEFFTKKILPDYWKQQREEHTSLGGNITFSTATTVTSPSVPCPDTSLTSTDVPPSSTSFAPPAPSSVTSTMATLPTKNIKKKFGDFFAFKRARTGRAIKGGGGGEGGECMKVKRTSIVDLIRPAREVKERDKEREKERGARSLEDANISNDAAATEGTCATSDCPSGNARDVMAPAKILTMTTPRSETLPSYPTLTTSPDITPAMLSSLEGEVVSVLPGCSPSPVDTSPITVEERSSVLTKEMKLGGTPYGERRLKVTKRSLREGKSQSLILLTGSEPEDKDNAHIKKHVSESTSSFEQRLQMMLHRMGVAKTPPADTKMSQSKDEELRKANSEGAILDKPEPPPTYMKPRTLSTSSDPRHPMTALDPTRLHPPLYPKPALPDRPIAPLPPKPAIAAKPPLPTLAAPLRGVACPSSAPSSSAEAVQLRAHMHDGRPGETTAQVI
uniref:CARMIL C-terminal domain-containing protein n=1 Tax=Monopterus albus TaxID=43700 RepID=A0A3Q3J5C8_MONAL